MKKAHKIFILKSNTVQKLNDKIFSAYNYKT